MEQPIYDRIMDLPLFKGSSRSQISDFVEKVQLQFEKYDAGRVIAQRGEICDSLILMLGGAASLEWHTPAGQFLLSHEVRQGGMIGSDMLFGMYCHYPCRIEAATDCSLMRISKKSFLDVVMSNELYLINLLNHSSLQIQRNREAILEAAPVSLLRVIKQIVLTLTTGNARSIIVTGSPDVICPISGLTPDELTSQANKLRKRGLITRLRGRRFAIPSRKDLLEATYPHSINHN